MMKRFFFMLTLAAAFLTYSVSFAVETKIVVRAKAKDAKFIGTSMGGGLVTIRDAFSREILAKGMIKGSTGNTSLLMMTPHKRRMRLADQYTAKFEAVLDLDEPRKVDIEVIAPYGQQQSAAKASITTWVVPGKHITGDGIIIEFPGLVVDVLNPSAHTMIKGPTVLEIMASVTPMCGCPINPNTFWKPDTIEVAAIVKKNGVAFKTIPLKFTGITNKFSAKIALSEPGAYQFTVYGYDPATGNTGVDMTTAVIMK